MRLFVTRQLSIDPVRFVGERDPSIEVRVFEGEGAPSRSALIEAARGSQTILTLVSDRVDDALLDELPEVTHIAQVAVGYDNVDVAACKARKILVTHTPDVLTDATADLTFALILAVARRLREGEAMLRAGGFSGWSPTMLLGMELAGATLGIYGFGRIGRAVARRASAFGMRVIYCSRSDRDEQDILATRVDFETLLETSDVISLHASLNDETRHVFDARALNAMKKGSILVNTARGGLIDEAQIASAIENGPLVGVGLDVYEREPRVHESLLGRDDVVLLPHLGSATKQARQRMAETALIDALRVASGQAPLHPIPELAP